MYKVIVEIAGGIKTCPKVVDKFLERR